MATLSGNKIKDTYQSLIKLTDNGNLTTGAKQLTDGFGNNSPLYISTTQIGIGVTPEATYDLHVYSNAKVGGNLTVTGDLTVEGTTTTIDTQTLTVEDPLIEVASNNTSTDAVDIGWYGKYAPSGTVLYAGLFRDTGDSKFKLFRNLEEQPTTTINTSGTGYTKADLVIGGLEATTGDFTDTVTVDGDIEVENSSGFGRIEIGGSSGGYIDLKSPFSDDFDLRLYTAGTNAQINAINGELDITAYTNINLQYQGTDVLVMSSTGVAVTGTGSFTGQVTIPETPVADTDAASKGYVDSQVTAQDLDFSGDSGTGAVDLDSQSLSITGGTLITTTALNQNLDIDHDSVSRTDTTSSASPSFGGTFTAVDSVTSSTEGHITAINLKTVTVPTPTYPAVNNNTITINAGSNLDTGGAFTLNQSFDETITIDLATTITGLTSVSSTTFSGQLDGTISSTTTATTQTQGDNSTKVATTAYVDSAVTAEDLDFAGDTGTGSVDLDSQTFTIAGTTNEIETSASGQTLTIGLPNDVIITGDLTAGFLGDPYLFYADATNARVDIYGNTRMIGGGTRSIQFINDTTNTIAGEIEFDHANENLSFFTNFDTTNPKMIIDASGQLNIGEYGSGSFTGTATYRLAVDSSGDVIEIPIGDGAVDGSGTANYVAKWSDTDTITNSVIYDDGTNVGIGTTLPDVKLHVDGGDLRVRDNGNVAFQIISSNSGNSAIQFGDDDDLNDGRIVYENTGDNMLFYTNDSERMRIDSSGKVLINQTSSATTAKLQVDGDIDMTGSAPTAIRLYDGVTFKGGLGDGQWAFGSTSYANDYALYAQNDLLFHAGTGSSIDMMIDATTHNVGIGTDSPDYKLTVNGSVNNVFTYSTGLNDQPGFVAANNTTTDTSTNILYNKLYGSNVSATVFGVNIASYALIGTEGSINNGILLGTLTAKPLIIGTNNAERMRITSGGDVGIGTDSPSTVLDVRGSGVAFPATTGTTPSTGTRFRVASTGGASAVLDFGISTGGKSWLQVTDRTDLSIEYPFLINPNGGNVGIGTTNPQENLHIADASDGIPVFRLEGDSRTYQQFVSGTKFYIRDVTAISNRIVLDDSGNVGIGETSPGLKLDVNGDIRGYGSIRVNASSTGSPFFGLYQNNLEKAYIQYEDSGDLLAIQSDGGLRFLSGGAAERMRISSLGRVEIGTRSYVGSATTTNRLYIEGNTSGQNLAQCQLADFSGGFMFYLSSSSPNTNQSHQFYNNRIDSSPSVVGSIAINSTTTSFNTTGSDLRSKKNIEDWNDSVLNKFESLQPKKFHFNFQEDTDDKDLGFIAQNEVDNFPEAYPLTDDDGDGEYRYKFNPSGMVVYLMKAIKEQQEIINDLKSRIEILENN